MRKTFVFYNDRIDYIQDMSIEEKWLFLQNILNYQNWWTWNQIPKFMTHLRNRIKKQLDIDNEKWEDKRRKRSELGILGNQKRWWKHKDNAPKSQTIAKAIESSQTIANIAVNVNGNVNGNSNNNKYIKEEYLINNPEKINLIENFINEDHIQIAYQIKIKWKEKYYASQGAELDKLIKDGYALETINTVCQFIKQSEFRSKTIMSIKKLREKDKDWIPWMVRMIAEIQKHKPKAIDLDAYHKPDGWD